MNFSDLSFVGIDSTDEFPKVMPWQPTRTGEYTEDCKVGRTYFAELSELMLAQNNPTFLSRVLSAQVAGGKWEGVEIGFSQAMSETLMRAG
ncbi:hypothetical protein BPNPMPFG_002502 [Mesorhizobium sp. AR07]|uniref:hypothetical protein n=1 Tax=Mesorhizobium sp. AR07 TaxID=2865838 RepID=UPI00215E45F8|nr:hypothetical protein [Mesorhizobium sp. AR07]UVK46792.1 hypothetical protein BPNPMPFG_002502 [Mesorhizobium sp. AR07]